MIRLLAAVALLGFGPWPASFADGPNPQIVAVLDRVSPALPAGVVVQAQVSLDDQLVAANPTSTVLEVIATDGVPFLRISRAGVLANVADPDWYESNVPGGGGSLPAGVHAGAAPHWARVSADDAWGWYDARVGTSGLALPSRAASATAPLGFQSWTVPLRYGSQPVTLSGHFEFYPDLGGFLVTASHVPAGLTASILQGRLPGVFLGDPAGTPVIVIGIDGAPFLRLGPTGVEVNTASRSWAIDQQARGNSPPRTTPGQQWRRLSVARTVDWLDPRLSYPAEAPPDPNRAATVRTWRIPLIVDGARTALIGAIQWRPAVAAAPGSGSAGGGVPLLWPAVGAAAAVTAAVTAIRRRRTTR
ncbi:MAG TPA: hypothetical protein VNG13_14720 [Mycobacteriales bacterium]|nr:hypothetical protein [Mycobacteriales bacterium]